MDGIEREAMSAEATDSLFEQAPVAMMEADVGTGRLLRVNAAFTALLGLNPEDCRALAIADLAHPEDRRDFDRFIRGLSKAHHELPTRFIRKSGSALPVCVRASLVEWNGGNAVAVVSDRTDHLRAEERHRTLVEVSMAALWRTNARGEFDTPQPGWSSITGQGWPEQAGFGWAAMVHPDDRDRLVADWQRALAEQSFYSEQARFWHATSGTFHHFLTKAAPILDADGRAEEWIGKMVDIEDVRSAADALQSRENQLAEQFAELDRLHDAQAQAGAEAARFAELIAVAQRSARSSLYAYDAESGEVTHNSHFAEITGYSADRFPTTLSDWQSYLHPDDAPAALQAVETALADCFELRHDYRMRHADGHWIWIADAATVIRDENGDATRLLGTITDVSDVKAAEEKLRRRTSEFETLADNIPALCWMSYANGDAYWYNRRWYEYTGTSPGEVAGEGWEQTHDPAVLPSVKAQWHASIETGREFEMTFPLLGWDGIFRPFLTRVVPIRDEAGDIIRWFGTSTDVAALKQIERELQARTTEMEALLSAAPIGLAYFDREHRFLRLNRELAQSQGVRVAACIGRKVRDHLPRNGASIEAIIDQVFASGEPVRDFELFGETPPDNGSPRHWLTGFFPVVANGEVDAVGAWFIEISERKAAEDRERLLAREVDHRAKNLLAVIQSVVQLSRDSDPSAFRASVTGRIQALGRAHNLLAESRWDGVELAQLATEELAPYLSIGEERLHIVGPPVMLRPSAAQSFGLILHELATNAIKYGALSQPRGSLDLRWRLVGGSDERSLELAWAEHGMTGLTAPSRGGFGSTMIRASVERQLRGKLVYEWKSDGVVVLITIPAGHLLVTAPGAAGGE